MQPQQDGQPRRDDDDDDCRLRMDAVVLGVVGDEIHDT